MALQVDLQATSPIPLNVAFEVQAGQILALVGPSGSGKTTVLRAVAGLFTPKTAKISVNGAVWTDTAAGVHLPVPARRIGMVAQSYALFPHMTAAQNVMAALGHLTAPARLAEALRILALVDLHDLANRHPAMLSGGQQQRVAVARALARGPQVLLLDEPFSAVDRPTREGLYEGIRSLRTVLNMPVVLVTHDMDEAQMLADTVVVLQAGQVVRAGLVADVLVDPLALRSIGLAEAGATLTAVVVAQEDDGITRLMCSAGPLFVPRIEAAIGTTLRLRVQAQDVMLARSRPEGISALNIVPVTVVAVRGGDGPGVLVELRAGNDRLLARITRRSGENLGLAPGVGCFAIVKSLSSTRVVIAAQNLPV